MGQIVRGARAAGKGGPGNVHPQGGQAGNGRRPNGPDGVADAWARHAGALAAWTDLHLVNRRDAFGCYIAVEDRKDPHLTALTEKASGLTLAVIERHYKGQSTGHLIGLHSTAIDDAGACSSRWLALDIDRHDDRVDPDATQKASLALHRLAEGLGFRALLFDSNGRGGYHLLLIFDAPAPTASVYHFGKWLCRDWKALGLDREPETFPKQPAIMPGKFGNWLRLPGRHHTRDHFTRVWDGSRWLDGNAAIKAVLKTTGTPATAIPAEALAPGRTKRPARPRKAAGALGRDAELARDALASLGHLVDDYAGWLKVGMCLTQLGTDGLALWDEWSRDGQKYQEGDCERKWRTFTRDGGLALGTLFQMAREKGWQGGRGRNGAAVIGPRPPAGQGPNRLGGDPPSEANGHPRGGPDDDLPVIVITPREYRVVDQAVACLAGEPDVFQRGNELVTVLRDPSLSKRITRPAGSPCIMRLPNPRIRELLTKVARWERPRTTRDGDEKAVPVHPPDWAVTEVAARRVWPEVRAIEAVTECPVLRDDGTILDRRGYDERSGLLYEPNAEFPPVPDRPSRDDARKAAASLLDLVADFPFAGEHHEAAWLAALLTPLARFGIAGPCPLFLIDANTPGTGKSKLTDIIAVVGAGREMPRTSYPEAEDEMRKRITSIALAGDRMMLLDNIATNFGGSALDSALTARTWTDRLLGQSQMMPPLPLFTVWYATGNNVIPKGDLPRRIVLCRLESPEERPEERRDFRIKGDLLEHVHRERPRLVRDALTILRAHAAAGRPAGDLIPMGSFDAWSTVVRQAVYWSIGLDPCATREELRAVDYESLARAALLEGWAELPDGRTGTTAAEALRLVEEDPNRYATLRETMLFWGRDGKLPSAKSLGRFLAQIRGRVIGNIVLQTKRSENTLLWRVEFVEPARR